MKCWGPTEEMILFGRLESGIGTLAVCEPSGVQVTEVPRQRRGATDDGVRQLVTDARSQPWGADRPSGPRYAGGSHQAVVPELAHEVFHGKDVDAVGRSTGARFQGNHDAALDRRVIADDAAEPSEMA